LGEPNTLSLLGAGAAAGALGRGGGPGRPPCPDAFHLRAALYIACRLLTHWQSTLHRCEMLAQSTLIKTSFNLIYDTPRPCFQTCSISVFKLANNLPQQHRRRPLSRIPRQRCSRRRRRKGRPSGRPPAGSVSSRCQLEVSVRRVSWGARRRSATWS
jgi:hypothetical protein